MTYSPIWVTYYYEPLNFDFIEIIKYINCALLIWLIKTKKC